MKTAVVLFAVLGVSLAQFVRPAAYRFAQPAVQFASQPALRVAVQPALRSADVRRPIAILSQSGGQSLDGSFNYNFESENGIQSSASSSVRALGPDQLAQSVQGSYSYTAPDGTPITVNYVADENGFHAEGAHLPTPPPIPEAIARSLEILPSLEEFERQEQQRNLNRRA